MTEEKENGTKRRRRSWRFLLYLPAVLKGLYNTLLHILKLKGHKTFTIQYPEKRIEVRPGFRGEHRLKVDENGREKCVACLMCQTVCPANCIDILAEEAPWDDRDKRAKSFEIDMLRCIYCGMCEEACPCDAIELTEKLYTVSTSRAEMIYDKEKLLSN